MVGEAKPARCEDSRAAGTNRLARMSLGRLFAYLVRVAISPSRSFPCEMPMADTGW